MSEMDFEQRLQSLLPYIVLCGFVFSPVYFAALLVLVWLGRKVLAGWIVKVVILGLNLVNFCVLFFRDGIVAGSMSLTSGMSWLFGYNPIVMTVPLLCILVFAFIEVESADSALLTKHRSEQSKLWIETKEVPVDAGRSHLFVGGTTGSGKTTYLMHYIEDSIKANEPLYIVSGKNGADDDRSLISMTKKLAKRYDRDLIIVSLNQREKARRVYNPLAEMSVTEVSDALASISDYTEPHYKACTTTWIKAIAECLVLGGIPLSLASICAFYSYSHFSELIASLKKKEILSKEKAAQYLDLREIAEEAELSESRYRNLLFGDGADLFSDGSVYENCSTARNKSAIFFIDLDSFRYSDFTQAVGKLFIHDIRHIISTETDMKTPKRVIMDELGSFATESMMPLFSQARSYGYQIIVATQSLADLDAVSETFSERVLENCGQYAVLQMNSAKDAERISNIIGTIETIETTRKSSGSLLDASGAGTKKVIHEYKVPPDIIKELPPLTAIYYNKRITDQVEFINVPFVV